MARWDGWKEGRKEGRKENKEEIVFKETKGVRRNENGIKEI